MKIIMNLFIAAVVLSCSCATSKLVSDKDDNTYGNSNELKKIYLFPIASVKLDDTVRVYTQYILRRTPAAIEDSLRYDYNNKYYKLATKYIKKNERKNVTVSDTAIKANYSIDDSNKLLLTKIFDKKNNKYFEIFIPKKELIDSFGIRCNYALLFSDLSIYLIRYSSPYFFSLFGYAEDALASGTVATTHAFSFGIKGKYVLWDYDKECAVCGGEFDGDLKSSRKFHNCTHDIIAKILDGMPFWSVRILEQDDARRR